MRPTAVLWRIAGLSVLIPVLCGFQADGQKNVTHPKQTQTKKQPSPPTANDATEQKTGNEDRQTDQNKEQQVRVVSVPEVRVDQRKDVLDWITLGCTVVLVFIGGIGTWAALSTLDQIKVEVKAAVAALEHSESLAKSAVVISETARDTAAAALLNAQAIINTERPWVTANEGADGYKLFGTSPTMIPKFSLNIVNTGRTPAKLNRVMMRFQKRINLNLPPVPDLNVADICPLPSVLLPSTESFNVSTLIEPQNSITHEQAIQIREGSNLFLVAYGVIEYSDVLETPNKSHKTGFCFYYAWGTPVSHGFQTYYNAPPGYLDIT